jgi:hypothetical protein
MCRTSASHLRNYPNNNNNNNLYIFYSLGLETRYDYKILVFKFVEINYEIPRTFGFQVVTIQSGLNCLRYGSLARFCDYGNEPQCS